MGVYGNLHQTQPHAHWEISIVLFWFRLKCLWCRWETVWRELSEALDRGRKWVKTATVMSSYIFFYSSWCGHCKCWHLVVNTWIIRAPLVRCVPSPEQLCRIINWAMSRMERILNFLSVTFSKSANTRGDGELPCSWLGEDTESSRFAQATAHKLARPSPVSMFVPYKRMSSINCGEHMV